MSEDYCQIERLARAPNPPLLFPCQTHARNSIRRHARIYFRLDIFFVRLEYWSVGYLNWKVLGWAWSWVWPWCGGGLTAAQLAELEAVSCLLWAQFAETRQPVLRSGPILQAISSPRSRVERWAHRQYLKEENIPKRSRWNLQTISWRCVNMVSHE